MSLLHTKQPLALLCDRINQVSAIWVCRVLLETFQRLSLDHLLKLED